MLKTITKVVNSDLSKEIQELNEEFAKEFKKIF